MSFLTRKVQRQTDSSGPLKVLQITDTHLFADTTRNLMGVNTEDSFRNILDRIKTEHGQFDLVLATGDIVHDASVDAYLRFKQALQDANLDAAIIAGNHDNYDTLRTTLAEGANSAIPSVTCENWHFVLLNSAVPGKVHGYLETDQLEFLQHALSAEPTRNTIVCVHHHPIEVHSAWLDKIGIRNGRALFTTLQAFSQVKALVWGHIHQELEQQFDDFTMYATPSTCVQFARHQDDFALDPLPPGFRIFELHSNGSINSAVHRLEHVPAGTDFVTPGYK